VQVEHRRRQGRTDGGPSPGRPCGGRFGVGRGPTGVTVVADGSGRRSLDVSGTGSARLDDLVGLGTLTAPVATFLDACVRAGLSVLVSGGT